MSAGYLNCVLDRRLGPSFNYLLPIAAVGLRLPRRRCAVGSCLLRRGLFSQVGSLLSAVCLLACSTALVANADDLPPGVVNTQNPHDESLSPRQSLDRITVPTGFHVTLFAGEPDIRRPIAFDFDDRGRLWVVENYSHPDWESARNTDRIVILEDSDQDGEFDHRTVFWDGGRYLTGIAWGHGGVWLANSPELCFIPDRDRDDVPDEEPIVVLDGFRQSSNNVLNNFHWGPDGWLYGAIGLSSPSLVGPPGAAQRHRTRITRGIWRFHPIRRSFEVVAEGMVNPWGADFNRFGDLFTTNTVIAHLWHIVPGMYCQRRDTESDNPFVYRRVQSIANHLHWGGDQWQKSSHVDERHSVAGGGHAHCGAMIYLGDNWPPEYRGMFFTANLHGNRINCDQLLPHRSTYVGEHAPDFLFANDPWFRGLSIKYGPDGGVYVSDWHDLGECHDNDGSHRSSGRIYKVVYGSTPRRQVDLHQLTSADLADLHTHDNEWFVRRARRLLHERVRAGGNLTIASERLHQLFRNNASETMQLRALWTLFLLEQLDEDSLIELLRHESEHVRRWAVRLLVDQQTASPRVATAMLDAAQTDASPKVRLALASALPRMRLPDRWAVAAALLAHADDAADPYLPLQIWYGIEPIVAQDATAALQLAAQARISEVRQFVARRLVDGDVGNAEQVAAAAGADVDLSVRRDLLHGMLEGLQGKGPVRAPKAWPALYAEFGEATEPALRGIVVRLAVLFGDQDAIDQLRAVVLNRQEPPEVRRDALLALLNGAEAVSVSMLHQLTRESSVVRDRAIEALMLRNDSSTPEVLIEIYPALPPAQRQAAVAVLTTRRSFAAHLLNAVESGVVDRKEISAFSLAQLRRFDDAAIRSRVDRLWANDAENLDKASEIARYKALLTPEFVAGGDVRVGRQLFQDACAKCHKLFGEGGVIGPDLTGSGRKQLDYVLSNLFDPSATIDPAYRLTTMVTTDGRLLSGYVVHQGDRLVTFRTQQGDIRLSMSDVESLETSPQSMMPDGMLRGLSDAQVRDLVLYLASPDQVPLPATNDER